MQYACSRTFSTWWYLIWIYLDKYCTLIMCINLLGFVTKCRKTVDWKPFFPFPILQVGMQNSSLGVVLATAHFSSPLVALPPALSAVIMNIMGSTLSLVWQYIVPSGSENVTSSKSNAWSTLTEYVQCWNHECPFTFGRWMRALMHVCWVSLITLEYLSPLSRNPKQKPFFSLENQ